MNRVVAMLLLAGLTGAARAEVRQGAPANAAGGQLYFSFFSQAYCVEKFWGNGTPLAGIKRTAGVAHAHGIPVTWLVDAKSAEEAKDLFTAYHETYGDDVALFLPGYDSETKPRGEKAWFQSLTYPQMKALLEKESAAIKRSLPWAKLEIVGGSHRNNTLVRAAEELGFKALWGHCWEQTHTDDISDRGTPWGFYYASRDCFKAPARYPGGLVAVEWTARDLNKAFHTGNPIAYSTDPNEVIRSNPQLCNHRQIDYWKRLAGEYQANAKWNAVVPLMMEQEAHEMEHTAGLRVYDQQTIDNAAEILDEFFAFIKTTGAVIVPASQAVAAYREANPSTPPTFAFVRDVTPPQVEKRDKDLFIYYDVNGQLFFDKGKTDPVLIRDYLNAHDPNAHDFAGVKDLPVARIAEKRDVSSVTFDCTVTAAGPLPYGFAFWGDYTGRAIDVSAPAVTKVLDGELACVAVVLKPGENRFTIRISRSDAPLPLVPQPVDVQRGSGVFELNADTRIVVDAGDADARNVGRQLAERVQQGAGYDLKIVQEGRGPAMLLTRKGANPALGPEGYTLTVKPEGVTIAATTGPGLFYGMQSFLHLLPPEVFGTNKAIPAKPVPVPALRIEDQPRFAWRGLMMDCSRTFQSLDYLRRTIDRMARYKMNVLHLHLADDQGWRMEIKRHPVLTQKGARFSAKYNEPASHEGFYTQAELRELVGYAAARNVTLVPEIEMPGHSQEIVVCRPDLSCAGKATTDEIFPAGKEPWGGGRINCNNILCAGNDETFRFLEEVLDEVMDVFPSKFIHIGGDEAVKDSWKACPRCQARIKAEGLKNEHELQSYFIRRIEKHIDAKGRRLIGWSEILEGGLAPNAAVMDWIGGADTATKAGHDAVMSPQSHCYFDHPCSEITTERAYSFEPCGNLPPEQAKHILGLQANFWSHIDREPELVDRQLFPRLLALAERGWSPADVRDWTDFKVRLAAQLPRLRQMGVHYWSEPFAHWTPQQVTETHKPLVWDAASEREGTYKPLLWEVSDELSGPGQYRVTFQYTGGACRLGLEAVELLADGAPVSVDRHRGMTGVGNAGNTYLVELKEYSPRTRYELRASARSEGGIDSRGDVTIERNP